MIKPVLLESGRIGTGYKLLGSANFRGWWMVVKRGLKYRQCQNASVREGKS